jgi:hypothetical protein
MVSVFLILAEVADKEFSGATLWAVSPILAAVSFALCRWRRWAAVLILPIAAVWVWLVLSEIRDRFVGPVILQELGRAYVIQSYLTALIPVVFLLLSLVWKRREPSNRAMQRTAGRADA